MYAGSPGRILYTGSGNRPRAPRGSGTGVPVVVVSSRGLLRTSDGSILASRRAPRPCSQPAQLTVASKRNAVRSMRGLLGLPLVLLHLRHAASLAVIDEQQQPNFSILRSAYVDALFQRRSAFNTSCSETELHHKEGSYFVCSLLSRNKTTEEHTAGRVRPTCLVVSVGIGGIWNLEDMLAARSCTVVAFDPTKEMKTVHQTHARAKRNVHFHYLGLGASPDVVTTLAAAKVIQRLGLKPYGSLDTRVIVPLAEIFRIARETVARSTGDHDLLEVDADRYNQTIDLLKIDCECVCGSRM